MQQMKNQSMLHFLVTKIKIGDKSVNDTFLKDTQSFVMASCLEYNGRQISQCYIS